LCANISYSYIPSTTAYAALVVCATANFTCSQIQSFQFIQAPPDRAFHAKPGMPIHPLSFKTQDAPEDLGVFNIFDQYIDAPACRGDNALRNNLMVSFLFSVHEISIGI
jgi:hypothetical protein